MKFRLNEKFSLNEKLILTEAIGLSAIVWDDETLAKVDELIADGQNLPAFFSAAIKCVETKLQPIEELIDGIIKIKLDGSNAAANKAAVSDAIRDYADKLLQSITTDGKENGQAPNELLPMKKAIDSLKDEWLTYQREEISPSLEKAAFWRVQKAFEKLQETAKADRQKIANACKADQWKEAEDVAKTTANALKALKDGLKNADDEIDAAARDGNVDVSKELSDKQRAKIDQQSKAKVNDVHDKWGSKFYGPAIDILYGKNGSEDQSGQIRANSGKGLRGLVTCYNGLLRNDLNVSAGKKLADFLPTGGDAALPVEYVNSHTATLQNTMTTMNKLTDLAIESAATVKDAVNELSKMLKAESDLDAKKKAAGPAQIDWRARFIDAAKRDADIIGKGNDDNVTNAWREYYNAEWKDCDTAALDAIISTFSAEATVYGYTAPGNPFVSFLKRTIKKNSVFAQTLRAHPENYDILHDAVVYDIVSEKDLEGKGLLEYDNIIFNEGLFKLSTSEMYNLLKEQAIVIQLYNTHNNTPFAGERGNKLLSTKFDGKPKLFIKTTFYKGNDNNPLATGTADAPRPSTGLGFKSYSDVERLVKSCFDAASYNTAEEAVNSGYQSKGRKIRLTENNFEAAAKAIYDAVKAKKPGRVAATLKSVMSALAYGRYFETDEAETVTELGHGVDAGLDLIERPTPDETVIGERLDEYMPGYSAEGLWSDATPQKRLVDFLKVIYAKYYAPSAGINRQTRSAGGGK